MQVRFAQREDLPRIIDLCRAHAWHEKAEYAHENKPERLSGFLFGPGPALKCLVVADRDTVAGYATFMKQFSTWDAGWYIYLDCLYLREQLRGKGFGRLIMEKIREYALAENCQVIQWQTPAFNEKAIHFYRGLGASSKTKERFFWQTETFKPPESITAK